MAECLLKVQTPVQTFCNINMVLHVDKPGKWVVSVAKRERKFYTYGKKTAVREACQHKNHVIAHPEKALQNFSQVRVQRLFKSIKTQYASATTSMIHSMYLPLLQLRIKAFCGSIVSKMYLKMLHDFSADVCRRHKN